MTDLGTTDLLLLLAKITVPLLVAGHGVAGGRRVTDLVQSSDFALTALDYAGIEPPIDDFGTRIKTAFSTHAAIERHVESADLVVGGVLVPGAAAPKLITRELVSKMKAGSVIVDVAIDQGGCLETAKATTHDDPIYEVDGIIHYCVANMPGAVARTSTRALTNATLPYAIEIANKGWKKAMQENKEIKLGANVIDGKVTYQAVADAFGLDYTPIESLIGE